MSDVGFAKAGETWKWRGRRQRRGQPDKRPANAFAALADLKR